MSVQVLKPGLLTSLQDAGRPGHAALGVGRAGAMDIPAWRLANTLVGNAAAEAALEITLLGPTLRFERGAVIALTGAGIDAHVGEIRLPMWSAAYLPAGSVLRLGGMAQGCRSYLAVRGGFAEAAVLGSCSEDLHAHIGPRGGRALRAGDSLALNDIAPMPGHPAVGDKVRALSWGIDPQPWFDFAERPLALLHGTHTDALDDASREQLHGARFRISQASNRTASRLDGPTLALSTPLELISEAALPGTVQLPPSGQPIVLMTEAPVTGGYPRIGQLAATDLPRLAQRRPGDTVSFRSVTLDHALARLAERQRALEQLIRVVTHRLEQA